MSNVLEAISKLKLKNIKNHFSNLVLYLYFLPQSWLGLEGSALPRLGSNQSN